MKTNALLIFTRNPQLGKVKTRLAKSIGDEKALQVYKDLLKHTMEQTQFLDCDKYVFYDTTIIENDIWNNINYHKKIQAQGDLGQRMQAAFEELFAMGHKKCIIVGSDLFDLNSMDIKHAFHAMDYNEVVIGPAVDGGYYLMGLKKINPLLFANKEWGTETVLAATLNDIPMHHVYLLKTLNDIDTIEDLEKSNYILQ
ncbi:TIGR04282 family arsenosugar biosynthesis glycosyltransferase [Flavobacterium algicola]|uniref:TIGR04282 family arsenosugar biosynthesis glycosyltransferase n=1 Tax=Flavobacterium algicola TaxID=556529 RepID=UPI001EFDB9F9|nr:TIGR04282 family arsenosugar biosynthesis glycosyltransferase [Flavobacterium algicola]MCG9792248.1 TIGR04282 family arsenosugar biosynthesis glycosyltransferase [Flavobacterium algicola]